MNLFEVIEELVEEKGLDRNVIRSIVSDAILAAYLKKYPDLEFKAESDPKTEEVSVLVHKTVVPLAQDVEDDFDQISLKKARFIDKDLDVEDKIWLPFEGKIGRIEILHARQIIASQIRRVESAAVHTQFKDKEGEIVHGTVHKCERSGTVIKIDDTLAFLPKSLTIPGDKCIVGHPIRALLKEVLLEPRNDNQLILDRASEQFLQILFEQEIPEVFEHLIEIKKIARIPGYKSKVIVTSNDKNIDPVGTCVGVNGSRIKPILKELSGEKIDIIAWSSIPDVLVKNALKPAEVNRVEVSGDGKTALVYLPQDQRSLAIGKMGQNITLASKLIGVDIQLIDEAPHKDTLKESPELDELDVFDK